VLGLIAPDHRGLGDVTSPQRRHRHRAIMDKKAPRPKIAAQKLTWHKAAALARKWQLNQLAGRLEEMARKPLPAGERSRKT
jgi:hypothetical protein